MGGKGWGGCECLAFRDVSVVSSYVASDEDMNHAMANLHVCMETPRVTETNEASSTRK